MHTLNHEQVEQKRSTRPHLQARRLRRFQLRHGPGELPPLKNRARSSCFDRRMHWIHNWILLTGAVADRAGQFYERCKNSGERSKKTRKLKGSQANQLRARYAAQSTSQGPASLGDYGHKHGVGTNHTPAAKSQVNQTHPTTNHHLALPPS